MSTIKQSATLSPGPNAEQASTGDVCIVNISPKERFKRLISAVIIFGIGLAVLAVLIAIGANRWLRLPLFFFFMGAAAAFFEWQDKTCVALTALQLRKLNDHAEKIEDSTELAQLRRQS